MNAPAIDRRAQESIDAAIARRWRRARIRVIGLACSVADDADEAAFGRAIDEWATAEEELVARLRDRGEPIPLDPERNVWLNLEEIPVIRLDPEGGR